MLISALWMALREIRRNLMRSFLTMLGIVIGVGAVIALVTLGRGATEKVKGDVSSLGSDMLTLMPGSARRGPMSSAAAPFTQADVDALRTQVNGLQAVAPMVSRSTSIVYGNRNHSTSVTGSTNDWFEVRGWKLKSGRQFADSELTAGTPLCILGATVVKQLFGTEAPLGEAVRVGKVSCRVVGVLESKGQSSMGTDQDDMVLMPLRAVMRRLIGNNDISAVMITVSPSKSTASVTRAIQGLMRERRQIQQGQEDDFNVRDMQEIVAAMTSVTSALTSLLAAIAGVSLLVGGIGIMNIMLVSVTERTREIGIRLSIGARGREVLLQFLVEAVVLSAFGGVLGIVLGLGGSYAAASALGLPYVVVPGVILLAFAFSAAVGVAFGFFPARRAARLNPIEALRHE